MDSFHAFTFTFPHFFKINLSVRQSVLNADKNSMPVVYRVTVGLIIIAIIIIVIHKVGLLCHSWREDVVPSLVESIRYYLFLRRGFS